MADVAARIPGALRSQTSPRHFNLRWQRGDLRDASGSLGGRTAGQATSSYEIGPDDPPSGSTRQYRKGELHDSSSPTHERSGSAKRFIYLENQFLWSPEIAAILADKIEHPPSDDFRILLLLPSRPNTGADDTRGVLGLRAAQSGRRTPEGFSASALFARSGGRADPIYVHAKVGIVDDEWLTIGSANLNEHSLFNDTEMNLVTHDAALARKARIRLWSEHLELPPEQIDGDPIEVIETLWKPISCSPARAPEQRACR